MGNVINEKFLIRKCSNDKGSNFAREILENVLKKMS